MELNLTCDIFKKSCVVESNLKSSLEKRYRQLIDINSNTYTDVYQDVKEFVKKKCRDYFFTKTVYKICTTT